MRPHALVAAAAEVPRARVAAVVAQRARAREAGAVAGRRMPAAEMGASPPRVEAALVRVMALQSQAAAVAHGFVAPAALAGSRLTARGAAPELPSAAHAQKAAMLHSAARSATARVVGPHQRVRREARLRWESPPALEDEGSQRAPAGCGLPRAACFRACRDEPGGPPRLRLARPPWAMCPEQAAAPALRASAEHGLQGHLQSRCLPVRLVGRGQDVPVVRGLQVSPPPARRAVRGADRRLRESAKRDLPEHLRSRCLPVRLVGRGQDVPVVRGLQVSPPPARRPVRGVDRRLRESAKRDLPEHLRSRCLPVRLVGREQDVPVVRGLQVSRPPAWRPVPAADRRLRESAGHGLQGHWRSQSFLERRVAQESDEFLGRALRGCSAWLGQ